VHILFLHSHKHTSTVNTRAGISYRGEPPQLTAYEKAAAFFIFLNMLLAGLATVFGEWWLCVCVFLGGGVCVWVCLGGGVTVFGEWPLGCVGGGVTVFGEWGGCRGRGVGGAVVAVCGCAVCVGGGAVGSCREGRG
jgi:hypothetical protein